MRMSAKHKIGILGGSFDPIHKAHIGLANAACTKLGLDKIVFVPTHQAPLRDAPTLTPDSHRIAMLRLSLESFPFPWEICDYEIRKGGTGYSIDTAKYLQSCEDAEYFWIIGSDHLSKLSKWKDIEELSKLATFVCAPREGFGFPISEAPKCAKIIPLDFGPLPDSSTFVRGARSLEQLHLMLDKPVAAYILKNKLYGFADT